jgi:DNA-binding MarR family transcriptional regulator
MHSARAVAVPKGTQLSQADYRALAEFRYQIRSFLRFSERAARAEGVEPQQHQLLLALKGLPDGKRPTIGTMAERLGVEHHTAVTLSDRLERTGLVRRERNAHDRREVLLIITDQGEAILSRLSAQHRDQLKVIAPGLHHLLAVVLARTGP